MLNFLGRSTLPLARRREVGVLSAHVKAFSNKVAPSLERSSTGPALTTNDGEWGVPGETSQERRKHKIPRKRASSMFARVQAQLLEEAEERSRRDPTLFEKFRPGDALECQILQSKSSKEPDPVRGIVLAKRNRGISSSFLLRDVVFSTVIEKTIPLYSPLLKSIKVLKKAAIHQGKRDGKRVRRSKLYYLRERDDQESRVTGDRR